MTTRTALPCSAMMSFTIGYIARQVSQAGSKNSTIVTGAFAGPRIGDHGRTRGAATWVVALESEVAGRDTYHAATAKTVTATARTDRISVLRFMIVCP